MKIAVVGTGYVGLVAGACLAETGNDVICVDVDEEKVRDLNRGIIPIHEPGLEDIVARNVREGRLRFITEIGEAVRASDIVFIAVGTPEMEDGSADLQHVLAVARSIGDHMDGEKVVVTKSTVPVGTARRVREAIEGRTGQPVHVCSNPEFLKEGAAVDDFMKPDRVVLGVDSDYARKLLEELYSPFVRTGNPILFMDVASAEITKYAANAMLATRISFMNMIARLCEVTGADVNQVRHGVGTDSRIGPAFLFPGIGYGGSCFPKDVKALLRTIGEVGQDGGILDAVEEVNRQQKQLLVERVVERFGEDLSGKTFAVWGLAFKPGTDDMREAPSLVVIEGILDRGGKVRAHDPVAVEKARLYLGDRVEFPATNYECLDGADGLVVCTEWQPYRRPDFERMRSLLRTPVIFDGRNIYSPDRMRELEFDYYSVGRGQVSARGGIGIVA
jgi:UDPglucose 6-dehydrogenase